ncbi:substrate-binding domain-containing protein [Paenibacillus sp. CMAA1364]
MTMQQRIRRLILAVIIIVVCSAFFSKKYLYTTHEEKNVTVILKTLNVRFEFWQAVHRGAEAAAKERGINLNIEGPLSEGDADTQYEILEAAIERKPHAIVIAPIIDERMRKSLASARAEGIEVVIMNMSTDMSPSPVVVGTDHIESGRLAAQTVIEMAKGQPVTAIISNHTNSIVTTERLQGIQATLLDYKDGLRGVYYADGSEERAYQIAKELLGSGIPYNSFITLNETASQGVGRALKEENRVDNIDLVGFDSTSGEVQLLESGVMAATIVQRPFNMGYLSVKTAIHLIDNELVDPIIHIESNVITKANMYTTENQKLLFPLIDSK